jgi:TolA-binding protein
MKKNLGLIMFVSLLCITTLPALADCPEPTSFLSDSQGEITGKYINFLICLHNQQTAKTNDLEKRLRELELQVEQINGRAN